MQTSGQFGVPPSEVPQYMGNNNNNNHGSSRGTSTASNSAAHGHMLINLSPKVPSSLPSPPSHANHGQSTFSSIAQDVAAAAPAARPPPHGLFQEQAHQQHYHFLQQQSAENVQKLQEQLQQKKPAIQKQGIHLQQQTPMMAAQPPPDQNQDSHHGQEEQQQHSLAIQHQLGLGLESYEGSANVIKPAPASNFNKALVSAGSADQTSLGAALDIDQAEEGGGAGNRWPRQETVALLQIRADMDTSFRDCTVKHPLWEEVSRKLGELGYERSAKKCKEKFENVNKYYKRTKEGKAGRQDGKNYRFFTQLEALSANTTSSGTPSSLLIGGISTNTTTNNNSIIKPGAVDTVSQGGFRTSSLHAARDIRTTESFLLAGSAVGGSADPHSIPSLNNNEPIYRHLFAENSGGLHLSSESSSDGDDDDDDDDDDYEDPRPRSDPMQPRTQGKKRKRKSSGRMMAFFEGLLNKVINKQEQMQQRFLEALEKRESDRMIREEAWRRQEMARMSREHELRAQERSSAATRDATIVAFLQKVTGNTVQLPPESVAIAAQPVQSAPPLLHDNTMQSEDHDPLDPNSKRWLKPEVLALIKLHSSLHSKFTEANPKGPLWEEISNGMARMGYASRTAKRCKEKWENINKYFKKAKESNKKRPENAKTCPYFHELDALYRKGVLGGSQVVTSNVKQLPYKPIIDHEYHDNENIMQQPSTSNTESHSGDGPVHDSEILAIMAIEQGTASDASAFTSNINVGGSNNNKNSNMVATHVENGGLSKGNMEPGMDSSQGVESTYDGLNVDSKASNARNGLTPDLELQLQQQSSIDLHQQNHHQQEYEKMTAGEQGAASQIQMQFAPKETRPSLASLPNSSSFMANLLHKLNSNITAEINASTTLADQE